MPGVCIYAIVGMKLKPDWFDGKLILTQAQVTELAAEKAEEELNREDAAEPAADDVDNDKAEFETAKSQAAPESDLENDGQGRRLIKTEFTRCRQSLSRQNTEIRLA